MSAAEGRRPDGDEGATLVEAAFVLPIVLLVIFAIIEFGLFFAATATTSSSSRAGARSASANFAPAGNKVDAADQIRIEVEDKLRALTGLEEPRKLWIYRADASSGHPIGGSGFSSCNTDCFRYTWDANTDTFLVDGGTWTTPDACITDGLDDIGVMLEVEHTDVTGFFVPVRTLQEHTVVRLEPLPISQCP